MYQGFVHQSVIGVEKYNLFFMSIVYIKSILNMIITAMTDKIFKPVVQTHIYSVNLYVHFLNEETGK